MAEKSTTNDKELLRRFCSGDEAAFKEIVRQNKDGLYGFIKRFVGQMDLVEDVFQETFLQLYMSRKTFDIDRPIKPWLFTIAANKAKDLLRKKKRDNSVSVGVIADATEASVDDIFNSLASDSDTPDDMTIQAETKANVRQVIDEMPENLREILILAYFEQFSYKQMADILSIPIGTVKSRLHSAVSHFAKKWKQMNNEVER
ncbi:MAG: RNA polymerase sigma factor [Sedimentisphaeraceae bacterium JB056]